MERPDNSTFVIFGGTGDLTQRKLMPALYMIYQQSMMPEDFTLIGSGRSKFNNESYQKMIKEAILKYQNGTTIDRTTLDEFIGHINYIQMDVKQEQDYSHLKDELAEI